MAYCSYLFHRVLVLVLLILVLVITQTSVISRADEQLMKKECHNADNPTMCLQCLTSDKSSTQADPVGLARIILRCLGSHVDVLVRIISSLLASHHREKAVETALKQCGSSYATAKRSLAEADGKLVAGDYDKAAGDVSMTTGYMVSCWRSVESVNETVTVPLTFRFHTRVYLALSEAELRIVDRF